MLLRRVAPSVAWEAVLHGFALTECHHWHPLAHRACRTRSFAALPTAYSKETEIAVNAKTFRYWTHIVLTLGLLLFSGEAMANTITQNTSWTIDRPNTSTK